MFTTLILMGVLAIILVFDTPRRFLFRLFHLGYLYIVWGLQHIEDAAKVILWILAALTVVVVACIANGWIEALSFISVLLGGLILILRAPFSIIPLGITKRVAKNLGNWAVMLFWITILMLFLPDVTTNVSITAITIVISGAMILQMVGKFHWFDKVLVGSTVAIMVIMIAVSLVAPLRLQYTDWRFANKNQMAVAPTTESIEELEQWKIEHPLTWSIKDQKRLGDQVNIKEYQQANVEAAAAQRGKLFATSNWELPSLDDEEAMINLLFVLTIVGVIVVFAAYFVNLFRGRNSAATHHS